MKPVRVTKKPEFIKKSILEMTQQESFEGNQLPSEDFLAKKFGVSLATIREALFSLQSEGILQKRHGSGNFIYRSVLDSYMRIDKFIDFIELLEESGYQVSVDQSDPTILDGVSHQEDSWLKETGMRILGQIVKYSRTFHAGGKPAIYATNYVPRGHFQVPLEKVGKTERLSDYIWSYCGRELAHALLNFEPIVAREEEVDLFSIPRGQPMITWREVFYTLDDIPICCSQVSFNPEIMKLRMLWKC